MTKKNILIILIFVFCCSFILGFDSNLKGINEQGRDIAPNVYLDCNRRNVDINYIKEEITFVNYVRSRQTADIHLIITSRRTGSGGREYDLKFIGLKDYKNKDTELKYYSASTDTKDKIRKGLVKKIKQGFITYISDTPLSDYISISYGGGKEKTSQQQPKDKWNHWSFRIGLRGDLDYEEQSKGYEYSLSASANRITDLSKITLWGFYRKEKTTYTIEEDDGTTSDYISETVRNMFYTSYIRSIDSHLSVGGFFDIYSSTYDNAEIYYTLGAGVEYNVFPYKDYTKRELRAQYKIEFTHRNYFEETIFSKLRESLFRQELQVILAIKEPWGTAAMQLSGLTYFYDFSKNKFRADIEFSMNVFQGLSFDINGNYSRVRDQLSLPKTGASKEEVLMEVKELQTGYNFSVRVGLSFRFGSIYSNIVNPRFSNPRHR